MIRIAATFDASPVAWVVYGITALGLVRGWPMVWRQWRQGWRPRWRDTHYTTAQHGHMERMLTANIAGFTCLLIPLVILSAGIHQRAVDVVAAMLVIIAIVSFSLAFSIRLWRRPQWAIPPVLRNRPIGDPQLAEFDRRVRPALRNLHKALVRNARDARREKERFDGRGGDWNRQLIRFERSAARLREAEHHLQRLVPPPSLAEPYDDLLAALEHWRQLRERAVAANRAQDPEGVHVQTTPQSSAAMRRTQEAFIAALDEAVARSSGSEGPLRPTGSPAG